MQIQAEELDTQGFVTVPYPPELRHQVQEAVESWKNFCQLSPSEKEQLGGGDRVTDLGYMRRNDTDAKAEDKELFHALLTTLPVLHEKAKHISDPRAIAFMNATETLVRAINPLIADFAKAVEERYHLNGFTKEVADSAPRWIFRYLHYIQGETLAHPHVDRGGFTLHLYESSAGGEYRDPKGKWHPWVVSDTQTIIFPGMVLQHRSKGLLKALWHRVVKAPDLGREGRFALVVFIDFLHTHRTDESIRRMRDFEEGFNYTMPHAEFEKFFIPA